MTSRFAPTAEPSAARVRSARWAVLGLFAIMGALLSTMLSRMPSIRDALDVTPAGLASLIIFGAAGALLALLMTGWAAARFGTRALLVWSAVLHGAAFSAVGLSTMMGQPALFAAANLVVSFAFAFTNVAMNAEAATIERHMGRAVMPQFHGAFSIGMAVGLGIGAGVSHLGIAPVWHFAAAAVVFTAVRLVLAPICAMDGRPSPDAAAATLGGPFATARAEYKERRVVLIGLIVFAASMTEMTAAQWMALTIVDDFERTEAVGDLVYWVFVIAMVSVRWFGAGIIGRLGRVVCLRVGAGLVVSGLLVFAFAPAFWMIPVGAALWGMGAALGVPIGFSAAADDPRRAPARVAAVASFSTIAGLMVPPLVGQIAGVVLLREALLVVAVASLTSFLLARAVRQEGPMFRSHRAIARKEAAAAAAVAPAASTGTAAPDAPIEGR